MNEAIEAMRALHHVAPRVYEQAVNRAIVLGWIEVVFGALTLTIWLLGSAFTALVCRQWHQNHEGDFDAALFWPLAGYLIVGGLLLLTGIAFIVAGVLNLIAPEAAAVKYLFG